MNGGLRDELEAALRGTAVDGWHDSRLGQHGDGHRFYLGCALCTADVPALLDALTPIVETAIGAAVTRALGELDELARRIRALEAERLRATPTPPTDQDTPTQGRANLRALMDTLGGTTLADRAWLNTNPTPGDP